MSQTPEPYTAPAWQPQASADADAHYALEHNDPRLLGYYTRGRMVPGIDARQRDKLIEQCGLRIIEGFGDVIRNDAQLDNMKAMHQYVANYNGIVAARCLDLND